MIPDTGRARVANSSGQAVAMATLFMFVMLGMGALVVDLGSLYQQHRSAQAVADSAALAGFRQQAQPTFIFLERVG